MKKIYRVEDTTCNYYFTDKISAIKFKNMYAHRILREETLYEGFDDYKNSQNNFKEELLNAIRDIKLFIDKFKSGYLYIYPETSIMGRTYFFFSKDIETILKGKKLPELVYYYDYTSANFNQESEQEDFTTKEFEEQYLDAYTTACKKALMKYEGLKARLKDYKAELKQLHNEKPNKSASENADIQ